MIHAHTYDTPADMHEAMCDRLMFGKEFGVDYDWTHGTEVGLHNVMLGCRSFDWSFDLKRLWIPESRWTMMIRQYLDPNAVNAWLEKIDDRLKGRGRGIAVLRTRMVEGRGTGRNVRRRWGSCMLNLSLRTNPTPTVSLHSRTTYFGYLAAMDITVAHVLARMAGDVVGIDPVDMQFVWTMDLAQFHGFRSLAWALGDPEIKAELDDALPDRLSIKGEPGFRKALDGYARILKSDQAGILYGDEKFSSFCRIRRRFHTEVMGTAHASTFAGGVARTVNPFPPLPSVLSDTLDLRKLFDQSTALLEEDDEDED